MGTLPNEPLCATGSGKRLANARVLDHGRREQRRPVLRQDLASHVDEDQRWTRVSSTRTPQTGCDQRGW